jgi:hypothetical protein
MKRSMNKNLSIALLIFLVSNLSACSSPKVIEEAGTNDVSQIQLPNILIKAEGNIMLRRTGWSGFFPVGFGAILNPGDLVRVEDGGIAEIFCGDDSTWDEGSLSLNADGDEHGIPCQSGAPPRPWADVAALRGEEAGDIPYVISPRNTALALSRPPLQWHGLDGVDSYSLSVLSDDGVERLTVQATGDHMDWPAEWQPIVPDATYVLIVEGGGKKSDADNPTHSGLGFWLLDNAESAALNIQKEQLLNLKIGQEAQQLLVSELLLDHQMRFEALQMVEGLLTEHQSPTVLLGAGKIYLELGLPNEAGLAFSQTIQSGEERGELEAQGQAHYGLGLAYKQTNEEDAARIQLEKALALFQQIGDNAQVAEIEKLLNK